MDVKFSFQFRRMPPTQDIGWDYGDPVWLNRKIVKCCFCDKVIHGGITRFKQHILTFQGKWMPVRNL